MNTLPQGTVTFLFTDVEGSTRLLERLGPQGYAEALAQYRRTLRAAFERFGGVEVDTQGDAVFAAFPTASGALEAVAVAQAELERGPILVRMGIHTGEPLKTPEGYVGIDVHRAARIAAAGHGGQVLVSAATESLARETRLVDLGQHRLKDLSAPERIYQLGATAFPPLRTLYRTNLPIPATPFVGRAKDVVAVAQLLESPHVRLVTVTGPGGVGKTRLALQTAAEAAERYPDGIVWVPLAVVRDPEHVLGAIADALELEASRSEPPRARLARGLGGKRSLVLVDNVEHVVDAVAQLADVMTDASTFEILATSREPLLVAGEHEYPLAPLEEGDAVTLFVERALAVRPDFEPSDAVRTICERLDRLPLALELAAARTRALSSESLLDRMDERLDLLRGGRGVDRRQRTLRATIQWSYELLDNDERELFARLAIFVGGGRIDDVIVICGADLLTLSSLVEKSLVRRRVDDDGGDRYWMLETIREFAAERLAELPEAEEVARLHAARFLQRADEAWTKHRMNATPQYEFELFAADEANMRAALGTLRRVEDAEGVAKLCAAMFFHWYFRGDPAEGAGWVRSALDLDLDEGLRSELENELGALVLLQGWPEEARPVVESSVIRARRAQDAPRLTMALTTLGNVHLESGENRDIDAGRAAYEEALALCVAQGGGWYERGLWHNLGLANLAAADFDEARRRFAGAKALAAAVGDRHVAAGASIGLAWVAVELGEPDEARAAAAAGLIEAHELGMRLDVLSSIHLAAYLDALSGNAARGARLLGAFAAVGAEAGVAMEQVETLEVDRTREALRAGLDDSAYATAIHDGAELSVDSAVALAREALAS